MSVSFSLPPPSLLALTSLLQATSKALPKLDEDDRLIPVLSQLSMGFVAGVSNEYSLNPDMEVVTAAMVDQLAQKHFPLCMRNLHDALRKDKHLRHFGRQQYNLFLKVGVLSLLPVRERGS